MYQKKNGVSLIVLVVTIVVILIISVAVLFVLIDRNVIASANEGNFKSDIAMLQEKLNLYVYSAKFSNPTYDPDHLQWNGKDIPTGTGKLTNKVNEDTIDVILEDIPLAFHDKITIVDGKLVFKALSEQKKQWVLDLGYSISNITDDIALSENILSMQPGTETLSGITCTIDDNGEITLHGKATSNVFIKISDGLKMFYSGNDLPSYITGNPVVQKGEKVIQQVTKLSGDFTGKQVNVVLRNKNNEPEANCKLSSDIYSVEEVASEDIYFSYLFISGGVTCNNLKLKVELKKELSDALHIASGTLSSDGFTCEVKKDGTILLNGTAKTRLYFRISDKLMLQQPNIDPTLWTKNGNVIAHANEKITLNMKKISGSAIGEQINGVIRYQNSGEIALSYKILEQNLPIMEVLTEDANVFYLYVHPGVICDEYLIKPAFTITK